MTMKMTTERGFRGTLLPLLLSVLGAMAVATSVAAQDRPRLEVEREDGTSRSVTVQFDRGYATVAARTLADLGWGLEEQDGSLAASAAGEITVSFRFDSPFFRWDGVVLQLTDPPYRAGGSAWIPLQFLTDFLPRRLPGLYEYVGAEGLLRAGDLTLLQPGDLALLEGAAATDPVTPQTGSRAGSQAGSQTGNSGSGTPAGSTGTAGQDGASSRGRPPAGAVPTGAGDSAEQVRNAGASAYDGTRVVIIDAGHGGEDPGALSPSGVREKTVALGIALELEKALRGQPGIEVHMIRDDDTFVDVWDRGQLATDAKGERPGIFVSIHANSFPARAAARGFETYFLSDARTEHERRVSAIENAPLNMTARELDEEQLADMDFILRDLRNYEHAHWSENLASLVQEELDDFHPGPNRGVKQGVLAVLTNALMPSVLIEIGYLSNAEESQLLDRSDFHRDSGEAIAEAVLRFFDRYPPGGGAGGHAGRR